MLTPVTLNNSNNISNTSNKNNTLNTSRAKLSLLLLAKVIFFVQFCSLAHSSGCCVLQEDQNFPQDAGDSTASSDLPAKLEDIQYTIEFTMDDQTDGEPDTSSPRERKFTSCKVQIDLMENLPAASAAASAAAAAAGFTDSPLYRLHPTAAVDEITLDVRIEENVPAPTEGKEKTTLWRNTD